MTKKRFCSVFVPVFLAQGGLQIQQKACRLVPLLTRNASLGVFELFPFLFRIFLESMEENDDLVVFRKKVKRASNVRRKKHDDDVEEKNDEEDALDVSEKILGAKFEQKMRKRAKGLAVTDSAGGAAVVEQTEVIGTEFTEQSNTTELDRAREQFVEEQIARIRRGEAPLQPTVTTLAPTTDNPKFVSGGFHLPDAEVAASRWAGSTKQVPEIELPKAEAERQYAYTKQVMEEQRRKQEQLEAQQHEDKERRVVYNFNALAFGRSRPPHRKPFQHH